MSNAINEKEQPNTFHLSFTKITIVKGFGCDKVLVSTRFPQACYPFSGDLVLSFDAARNSGVDYCAIHFSGVKVKVVDESEEGE